MSTLRRWGTTLAGLVASSAARSPSRPALIDDEGVLTFAELDERGARLAAGLPCTARARGSASCAATTGAWP